MRHINRIDCDVLLWHLEYCINRICDYMGIA